MKQLLVLMFAALWLPGLAKKKTIYINSEWKTCSGVAPMQCMEYRDHEHAPWTLLYGGIEGFTFEPGYAYTLRIKESKIKNAPADGSSVRRQLVRVLSKEPVMKIALPHQPVNGKYLLQDIFTPNGKADLANSKYMIDFNTNNGVMAGKICNSFSASFKTSPGNVLTIGMVRSTKMMCPNIAHETALLNALALVNNYSIEDGKLVLKKDADPLIVLSAIQDEQAVAPNNVNQDETSVIRNTVFSIISMYNNGKKMDVPNSKANFKLDDLQGRISGKSFCNNYFGNAKIMYTTGSSGTINIDRTGSTMMACMEGMDHEKLFFNLLEQADNFEYRQQQLFLKKGKDTLIVMQGTTTEPAVK